MPIRQTERENVLREVDFAQIKRDFGAVFFTKPKRLHGIKGAQGIYLQ